MKTAQAEEDFPDYMAAVVLRILSDPDSFNANEAMLNKLNFMISEYNTYAETCCEKIGISPMDMEKILKDMTGESPSEWITPK